MKIIYSETALKTLSEIIDFLEHKWTSKEIDKLKNDIFKFEQTIYENIITHQYYLKESEIRFMLIAKKQVKIFYKKTIDNKVQVIAFWHSKGSTKNLRKLLKSL